MKLLWYNLVGISQKKKTKIEKKTTQKNRKINLVDQWLVGLFVCLFTTETLEASNNVKYLRITEENWFPTNNSIPGLLQVIF